MLIQQLCSLPSLPLLKLQKTDVIIHNYVCSLIGPGKKTSKGDNLESRGESPDCDGSTNFFSSAIAQEGNDQAID